MRNSITLNGISSNSINGLLIQSLPPITKPLMRTEIEQIDGRAGDIVTNLGFSSYNKEFTIGLYGDYDVDQVIAFFNSEGIVTFSNEPDKYYNYQIIDQIDFEKLIRFKTAKVTMHCQPFKYSTTETPIIVAGVNLISFDDFTQTKNGITITASDGNISLSGTSSANTEIYMPINSVALDPGDYELQAFASGTNPEACSLRLIYNSPSSANSFGGTYITLVNNMDVNIESTLAEAKTYNYLYFYIPSGQTLDFRVATDLAMESISGSGSIVALDGTAEAQFSQFNLKGNTEQTTYSGKNLLQLNDGTTTLGGVPITTANGTVNLEGTATSGGQGYYVTIGITASEPMVFSTNKSGTTSGLDIKLQYKRGETIYYSTVDSSLSLQAGDIIQQMYLMIANGSVLNGSFSPMLEKGSTKTSFEPYVGGTASPNPDYPQDVKVVSGENVIKICGKNLFNYTKFNSNISGLTTIINSDGSLTTSGIPTVDYTQIVPYQNITDMLEDGATYKISQSNSGYPRLVYIEVIAYKASGGVDYYNAVGGVFTVNKTTYTRYIVHVCSQTRDYWGNNIRTFTSNYQLEKGSIATSFEPYKEQTYNIDLTPNLYNYENRTTGKYIDSAGAIGTSAAWDISDFMPVSAGETYRYKGITTPGQAPYSALYDSSKNFVSSFKQAIGENTLTIPSGVAYVRFSLFSPTNDSKNFRFLDVPNGIELCKIGDYQDYIYKDGDGWYLHKAVGKYTITDLSSLDSLNWDSSRKRLTFKPTGWGIKPTTSPSEIMPALSNKFEAGSVDTVATALNNGMCLSTGGYISLLYNGWNNGDEARAAVMGTKFYYVYEDPVEEEITNENLITQLEAVAQANSYRGITHIVAVATTGNLPFIMNIKAQPSNDGVVINAGNIVAKPKLTIYGSGDIAVYINGNQLFNIALGDESYITIDTNLMEAYKDTPETLKNRLVDGDYNNFALQPGENTITFSGSVDKCIVEDYSRWI